MPLVGEVDEMLACQRKSMEFARARAADLAHGLKTPLSVLRTLAARIADKGDGEKPTRVDELAGEMDDRIDYQLRLSRLRMRTRATCSPRRWTRRWSEPSRCSRTTQDGERLDWLVDMEQGLTLDIDQHDLMELVGVLLENAAKWGR